MPGSNVWGVDGPMESCVLDMCWQFLELVISSHI